MTEVGSTTTGAPTVGRQDPKQRTAPPGDRNKLIGNAIQSGLTGDVVGELADQGIAQRGELNGRTLTVLTGSDAAASSQATGTGQRSSLGTVLDRERQPDIGNGPVPAQGAVSPVASGHVHASRSSDRVAGSRSESYEAVKAAGNRLVPLLKKDERDNRDALFTKEVKASVKSTVSRVSSTANRLDPGSAETVSDHVVLSKIAYKGIGGSKGKIGLPGAFVSASPSDLPAALRPCYDSRTGLLEMPEKGGKALVVKTADAIVVAFAGTQATAGNRDHTLATDTVQRCGIFDPMYRDAAGIVGMMLDHPENRDRTVQLTGHSLGGGLALFSHIANTAENDAEGTVNSGNMETCAFNSAGLSTTYLAALGEERITRSADRLTTVRVAGDPVSPSGTSKVGEIKGRCPGKTVTLKRPPGVSAGFAGLKAHTVDTAIKVVKHAIQTGGDDPAS